MNDKWAMFQKFLIAENAQISMLDFAINSAIVLLLSFVLSIVYRRYARSLSNRRMFAANFMLLTFTTMLIISIVKSSLALSLGLVGALSIVRFRSAIKEPEELAYLFLAISIGLGLGANQRLVVLVAFAIVAGAVVIRYYITPRNYFQNLYFTVSSKAPAQVKLSDIVDAAQKHFGKADLKRFDEGNDYIEASFIVEVQSAQQLQSCKEQLQQLSPDVKVIYVDNSGY